MNKQIYLGGTPLIDLSGYATESYVDTAVSNVDVTDQLANYALKSALDASIDAVDASIKSSDASIAAIKSTLAEITGEGAEADTIINTWNEMKQFVADYTTANDLSTLIAQVKEEAVDDASADAASKYQPIGSYLVADDISTFVDAADVADAINSSIAALDLANTYQAKGDYLVADDISTFITSDDISTFVDAAAVASAINSSIAALDLANTYETKNDASNHVAGSGVTNIVHCTSTEYAQLETKSATTLYIVSD
jgi:hypothetical protein